MQHDLEGESVWSVMFHLDLLVLAAAANETFSLRHVVADVKLMFYQAPATLCVTHRADERK